MASVYQRGGKGKWIVAWTDEHGKRRTATTKVSTAKGKRIAQQIAGKLETEADLRRRGIIDPRLDHYSQGERLALIARDTDGQIIGGHLADFHKAIEAGGNTPKHARLVRTRAAEIIDRCEAGRISDLSESKAQAVIQELRDEGLSLQTCNHYLRAVKQFTRWLWRDGRARDDALAHLQGYNVKLDRRHDRRALSLDDFDELVKAAERGPKVLGMTGPERAMLYRVAVNTAFRASELASLTAESFNLDGDQPTVTVKAGYSKHRAQDVQPIRPDLASILRAWLADKQPGERVFTLRTDKAAKMMRADLAVAEIPYRDSAGLVADFHSLRHSAGTWLKDARVDPKTIQTFMRHSTITLTMDRYVHPSIAGQTAALDHLPATNTEEGLQRICSAPTAQHAS